MKFNKLNKLAFLFVALITLASLSSCNRGYGCPTNFSMDENVVEVLNIQDADLEVLE